MTANIGKYLLIAKQPRKFDTFLHIPHRNPARLLRNEPTEKGCMFLPPESVTLRTHRMPFHRRNIHQESLPSFFQALPRTPSQDPSEVVTLRTHRTTIPRRNIHQGSHLFLFQALPRPPSQDPSEVATLRTHRMPFHRRNIHLGSLPSLFLALPRAPS